MNSLEKYLLKSGHSRLEVSKVLKEAGQKRMSDKLKMSDKSGDELPIDSSAISDAVKSDAKTGSLTKVKNDGGKAVMSTPEEFGHGKYGKKSKKPYLD